MSEPRRLHALITGRIQGVGSRYFVLREAQLLGLSGFVRNAGSQVEVVAEGEILKLERLLSQLSVGPFGARVDNVQHSYGPAAAASRGFAIRSTAL